MKQKKREPLVVGHAEDFHIAVLERHLPYFRDMIGRRTGLYVLYRGREPYYVGIASSLRSRLADHLVDGHGGKWDRFSFFGIRKGKQKCLSDLESLLIRAAKTKKRYMKGNKQVPKFARHQNIKKAIMKDLNRLVSALRR